MTHAKKCKLENVEFDAGMDGLSSFLSWFVENEAALSGVAATVVILGFVASPLGAGLRGLVRRWALSSEEFVAASATAVPSSDIPDPREPEVDRPSIAVLPFTPAAKDEARDPWQVALGSSFTIGLPPGVRARRMDGGVPPPFTVPGGLLWFRGRYTDINGTSIVIGDGSRVGYIAEIAAPTEAWTRGRQIPLGVPGSSRKAFQGFPPTLREFTGASHGTVERWSEPGFAESWLLFRLQFAERGPMLVGNRDL